MAGIKIVDLPALGRDLISTDLLEVSLNGSGSRKITGQEIMNASKLAVGSTPIVSGTVGRLLFQGTGNVLGQNSFLFWDNSNTRLGVGTNTPLYTLDVAGNIHGSTIFSDYNIVTTAGNVWLSDGYAIGDYGTGNNRIEFYNNRISLFGNGNEAMRIVGSTQNVLIGTTTDSGQKLNVNGSAIIRGGLSVNVSTPQITTVNAASGNKAWSWIMSGNDLQIREDGIGFPMVFKPAGNIITNQSGGNFLIGTTTDNGFRLDVNGTARVKGGNNNSLIIDNDGSQYSSAYIRHNGNTRMQLTWDSSANSGYIGSGNTSATTLQLRAGIGSTFMILHGTGNVGIGTTTDAGFKLDVNGTARVQSTLTVSAGGAVIAGQLQANGGLKASVILNNTFNTNGNSATIFQSSDALGEARFYNSVCAGFVSTINASAILQAESTTKGFLPPRMTNAQRAAIASPAVGLIVYCTDSTEGLYVYKSTGWTFMV